MRLKRDPTSANRIRYYRTLCTWLWIATLIACLAVGWRSIFNIEHGAGEASWLFGNIWVRYTILVILIVFAAIMAITYLQVAWMRMTNKPRRYATSDAMQKLSYAYLFPATWAERRWWVLVGLTAGICEEILFRGFLLHYLRVGMNLTLALAVAALIFGLQHLYQGSERCRGYGSGRCAVRVVVSIEREPAAAHGAARCDGSAVAGNAASAGELELSLVAMGLCQGTTSVVPMAKV